ncbi:MAG: hypothetical protein ISS64_06740 [Desulfobacterales bacterium]|nr:hypothetical protein [Desulfobacterales bacterium]
MDINKIDNAFKSELSSSKKVDSDNQFRQILDRTLHKIEQTTAPVPVDRKTDIIRYGDNLLNLLDDYAGVLTDPGKTLKEIEPLVATIEKEVSLIEAAAADNVQHDHELAKFIQDLTVTANVAVLKFHRGDFI